MLPWGHRPWRRYDDADKSLDEIVQDFYETSDAHSEPLALESAGTSHAPHQAAADLAYARALPIEAAIGRQGGEPDSCVHPVQILDTEGRIVSRRSTP